MVPRPCDAELEGALERGELRYAITLAAEVFEDHGRVPLETAARFLPLVLRQRPGEYERWALRWLARWISEARREGFGDRRR